MIQFESIIFENQNVGGKLESKEQMGNEFHYKAVSLWKRHF